LSRVLEVTKSLGKEVLAVLLFGSYVYSPRRARDIDVLVVVDRLRDVREKIDIELEIARRLRREVSRPIDIVVLDLDSFRENLAAGSFLSGLVIGYRAVYDAVGVSEMLRELFRELAEDSYVYVKRRRWNLSAIARARLRSRERSDDGGGL